MNRYYKRGFTLIEVLLVIAILAILAAVVIIAINPGKQFGEAQNAQRRSDVRAILDAVHQYSIDNNGEIPDTIPVGTTCLADGDDICRPDISCEGVSLDVLVSDQTYLTDLPLDPSVSSDLVTGYLIMKTDSGRIGVCAPDAYGDDDISVSS